MKKTLKAAIIEAVKNYDFENEDRPEFYTGARIVPGLTGFSVSATKADGKYSAEVAFHEDHSKNVFITDETEEGRRTIKEVAALSPEGLERIEYFADMIETEGWFEKG